MLRLLPVLLLAFSLAACDGTDDDDAPPPPTAPQSVAGVWEGTLTHSNPNITDGSLTLTLTQVDRAITGTAAWRYGRTTGGGPAQSVGDTGSVLGTVPASGPVTYTISFQDSDRQLHDMTLSGSTLSGTWRSEGGGPSSGTSTLTRR